MRAIASLVALSAVAAGCNAISGVHDLSFRDDVPKASAATSGSGAAAGEAAAGGGGTGGAGACPLAARLGTTLWSRHFGADGDQQAEAVAVDSQDRVTIAGHFAGIIDIGLVPPLTDFTGMANGFVLQLDAAAAPLWQLSLGDPAAQFLTSLAITSANQIYVSGAMSGNLSHGAYNLSSAGNLDMLVLRLDNDGGADWLGNYGDAEEQSAFAVATDPADNAVFTGWFDGSFAIGGSSLSGVGNNLFVAKLTGFSNVTAASFSAAGSDNKARDVATASDGGIAVVGAVDGPVDFGAGPVMPAGRDAFVLALDGNLAPRWGQVYGDASPQSASAVAFAGSQVIVGGNFAGSITLDRELESEDAQDGFVASIDETGTASWSLRVGGPANQEILALTVDGDGNILAAGRTESSLELCGVTVPHSASYDAFLLKVDAGGVPLALQLFGAEGDQWISALAVDSAGDILVVGSFNGTLPLAGRTYVARSVDMFVAKLRP
jgi:hypothetical protein